MPCTRLLVAMALAFMPWAARATVLIDQTVVHLERPAGNLLSHARADVDRADGVVLAGAWLDDGQAVDDWPAWPARPGVAADRPRAQPAARAIARWPDTPVGALVFAGVGALLLFRHRDPRPRAFEHD